MTEGKVEVRELPKGWLLVTIDEIASVGTGATPLRKNSKYYDSGTINWVTSSSLNEQFITRSEEKITELAIQETNAKVFPKHTLLIAMYGEGKTRGKVSELLIEAATNQACAAIILNGSASRMRKYIKYFLLKNYNEIRQLSSGGVQPNLNLGIIKSTRIPFASINEQERIVEKIEELFSDVDQGIESLKTAQKQLKVYRQAVLKWAFEGKLTEEWRKQHSSTLKTGEALLAQIKAERENRYQQQLAEWEEKVREWEAIGKVGKKPQRPQKYKDPSPISNAQTSRNSSTPESWCLTNLEQLKEFSLYGPRFSSQDYVDDGIPIVRTTDISSSGKVDLKCAPKINLSDQEFEKYKLIKGDLLLTRTGSIGTNAVFHSSAKAIPGAFLIHYRLMPPLNIWFVFYFLESPKAKQHFFEKSAGVGRPNLNVPSIEELIIPLPSLEEQEQIVEEIESRLSICDRLEDTIIENLQKAEALRQSILKQAFAGKLVPQDPNDEPAEKLLERIKAEREANQASKTLKQLKIKGL